MHQEDIDCVKISFWCNFVEGSRMKTRTLAIFCIVAFFISGLVSPIVAEQGDKMIRVGVLYSLPMDDLTVGDQTTELDGALGFQASFEYLLTDRLGIEPGISSLSYDLSVEETGFLEESGDTSMLALAVNLNYHFVYDSGLDLSVGAILGYAMWDDIELDGFPDKIMTDDEFMYGINFNLDYPFGDGAWGFNAGVDYLFLDVTPPGASIGVDPLQLHAGVMYNF
jgi:outer membrane protein W